MCHGRWEGELARAFIMHAEGCGPTQGRKYTNLARCCRARELRLQFEHGSLGHRLASHCLRLGLFVVLDAGQQRFHSRVQRALRLQCPVFLALRTPRTECEPR